MPSAPRLTSIADAQAGAIAARQVLDAGVDPSWIRRRVEAGHWQRLHPGVFVAYSGPLTWRTRAYAALLHAGPGAALSHEAAAFLLDFRPEPPRILAVSIPERRRVVDRPGIVVHRRRTLPPSGGRPRRTWRGDTVVDLVAASRSDDDAVGWVCDAIRAGVRLPEIADALTRRQRVRNRRLLAELLADVAAGIESPLERRYHRDVEHSHGLPRSVLQMRDVIDGRWIRADCVYRGLGVRVELDGSLAHPDGRTDADTWRDNAVILARGEITLRYRWRHVAATPCATAGQIAAALAAGGWEGRTRPCGPGCHHA